jgi:Lrp/AsnC family transcriptional regulator, regulator for asnA, asnC and gidA
LLDPRKRYLLMPDAEDHTGGKMTPRLESNVRESTMASSSDPLDKLDYQIIEALRTDARRSNTDLAKQLGVSEGTIRNRIRRMINEGYMIVVAMTRLHKLGFGTDVSIRVTTEAGRQMEVAQRLSAMPATRYVAVTTGAHDVAVTAVFRNDRELFHFLTEEIAQVPGIVRTETSHILRTLKRVHDWVIYEGDEDGSTNGNGTGSPAADDSPVEK